MKLLSRGTCLLLAVVGAFAFVAADLVLMSRAAEQYPRLTLYLVWAWLVGKPTYASTRKAGERPSLLRTYLTSVLAAFGLTVLAEFSVLRQMSARGVFFDLRLVACITIIAAGISTAWLYATTNLPPAPPGGSLDPMTSDRRS